MRTLARPGRVCQGLWANAAGPPVGDALQALGAALRYRGVLDDRLREAAIVVAAGVLGADYELRAHLPLARAAGLAGEIDGLLSGDDSASDALVTAIARATRGLAIRGIADEADMEALLAHVGAAGTFELVVLVGALPWPPAVSTYRLD